MFKRINRLTKQKDFDNIFKTGVSSFDRIIGVKIVKNNLKYNRFGVIVGKKVSKKAVIRNKVKRRLREVLKVHNKSLKQGIDVVVIALPLSASRDYFELYAIIEKHLKKLRLFNV